MWAGGCEQPLARQGWVEEQLDGVDSLFFVRRLAEQVESDWPGVLVQLEAVKRLLVDRNRLIADVTLDGDTGRTSSRSWMSLSAHCRSGGRTGAMDAGRAGCSQGLSIPAQVNYVGKGHGSTTWAIPMMGRSTSSPISSAPAGCGTRSGPGGAHGAYCSFGKPVC